MLNQAAQEWTFVDFLVSLDKVVAKVVDKIINFSPLDIEIRKMHQMLTKICSIGGCLFGCGDQLEGYLKERGIPDVLRVLETSAVTGTTLIPQKTACP